MPEAWGGPQVEALETRNLLTAGGIDASFHFPTISSDASAEHQLLLMHDGRFVVATLTSDTSSDPKPPHLDIRRFERNGAADPDFHITLFGGAAEFGSVLGRVIAFDAHDRMLVAFGGRISRFARSGALDKTFAGRGWIRSPLNSSVTQLLSASDGKVIVAGDRAITDADGTSIEPDVVRFNENGAIDDTFASHGTLALHAPRDANDDGYSNRIDRIVETSRGRLIALYTATLSYQDPNDLTSVVFVDSRLVQRFNADGTPDHTLKALDGATQFFDSAEVTASTIEAFAVLPGGGMLLAASGSNDEPVRLIRLRDDGSFDSSFGTRGRVDLSSVGEAPRFSTEQILVQSDGRILIAGFDDEHAYIARLNSDGSIDVHFGDSGRIRTPEIQMALDSDGSVLELLDASDSTQNATSVQRLWLGDAPVVTVHTRSIDAVSSRSQTIDLTIRDDVAVDLATLGRNLRVTGPKGYIAYARFDSVVSSSDSGKTIVARYKLAAPGGSWDASENGEYSVQLINRSIRDSDANGVFGRTLGSFNVRI